jgi:nitroreductase
LIRKILEAGVCAPSGGNMQRWRFLVICDPKVKETVGGLYKRAWDPRLRWRFAAGALISPDERTRRPENGEGRNTRANDRDQVSLGCPPSISLPGAIK